MEASVSGEVRGVVSRYYTVAEAAREAGVSYQRIGYAIFREWIIPAQRDPILISDSELRRYKRDILKIQ